MPENTYACCVECKEEASAILREALYESWEGFQNRVRTLVKETSGGHKGSLVLLGFRTRELEKAVNVIQEGLLETSPYGISLKGYQLGLDGVYLRSRGREISYDTDSEEAFDKADAMVVNSGPGELVLEQDWIYDALPFLFGLGNGGRSSKHKLRGFLKEDAGGVYIESRALSPPSILPPCVSFPGNSLSATCSTLDLLLWEHPTLPRLMRVLDWLDRGSTRSSILIVCHSTRFWDLSLKLKRHLDIIDNEPLRVWPRFELIDGIKGRLVSGMKLEARKELLHSLLDKTEEAAKTLETREKMKMREQEVLETTRNELLDVTDHIYAKTHFVLAEIDLGLSTFDGALTSFPVSRALIGEETVDVDGLTCEIRESLMKLLDSLEKRMMVNYTIAMQDEETSIGTETIDGQNLEIQLPERPSTPTPQIEGITKMDDLEVSPQEDTKTDLLLTPRKTSDDHHHHHNHNHNPPTPLSSYRDTATPTKTPTSARIRKRYKMRMKVESKEDLRLSGQRTPSSARFMTDFLYFTPSPTRK